MPYRRKKLTFAISSPDEFLYCIAPSGDLSFRLSVCHTGVLHQNGESIKMDCIAGLGFSNIERGSDVKKLDGIPSSTALNANGVESALSTSC